MKHNLAHYLLSSHGTDLGMVMVLPKNVRVYMYCYSGVPVSAEDKNEVRTWYMATKPRYDDHGKYMKELRLNHINGKQCDQYCVFSGNLGDQDMNRIPDLLLEEERDVFHTGLYRLPVRYNRTFLRDHDTLDRKRYRAGQVAKISVARFHQKLRPFLDTDSLPDRGFLPYFISPSTIKHKPYSSLAFVVSPNPAFHRSFSSMYDETRRGRKIKHYPNTKSKASRKVASLVGNRSKSLYLSDVIRMLQNAHPGGFVSIVVSACRSFHEELPENVRTNMKKSATVSVSAYIKDHADADLRRYRQSISYSGKLSPT